jgi:hypothetical protein
MNYSERASWKRMKPGFLLLLAGTTAFEGIRAGAGTFRMILDLPARNHIGPVAFAELSRATDLSPVGIVFYVVYGFGGALLTGLTLLIAVRATAPRGIQLLTGVAAICSVLILAFTTQAAPLMWSVGTSANDPAVLKDVLDHFTLWTDLRVICADVSFLAVLLALTNAALNAQNDPR